MSIGSTKAPTEPDPPLDADIDYEQFITEDDAPVDSIYAERQHRLLLDPLCASWSAPGGQPHVAFTDVGVFYAVDKPAVVPDIFVSLGVKQNPNLIGQRKKSFFIWLYGKPPDVVIEVVCNRKGGEIKTKKPLYERIGVTYYVIWDPDGFLRKEPLRCMRLIDGKYTPCDPWIAEMNLGLKTWDGDYDGYVGHFLRWCDAHGNVLATGLERAIAAEEKTLEIKMQAAESSHKVKAAAERADAAEEKLRKLTEKMQALGIDPENL